MPLNKAKENLILLIGFILIALVALMTFLRPFFKDKEKKDFSNNNTQTIKEYPTISAKKLSEKIINKEKIFILDVRTIDEYQREHIIDSINIPLEELIKKEINAPVDANIVILGSGNDQANQAAEIMKFKGFQNLFVLSGGLTAWKNNNEQTISWGDPTSFVNRSKVTFISLEDAKKAWDEKNPVYWLDVRPKNRFSPHIPGAINIPLEELEQKRNELPLGKKIIVYGATELEGFQAGVRLYDLNIFSAFVLRGGFSNWKEKGYPVE